MNWRIHTFKKFSAINWFTCHNITILQYNPLKQSLLSLNWRNRYGQKEWKSDKSVTSTFIKFTITFKITFFQFPVFVLTWQIDFLLFIHSTLACCNSFTVSSSRLHIICQIIISGGYLSIKSMAFILQVKRNWFVFSFCPFFCFQ